MKILKKNAIPAWHFLPADGLTANGEGIKVVARQTLKVEPPVSLCNHGYHASVRVIDALGFAPGPIIQRVAMWGDVRQDSDKLVASNRTCLWIADATRTLHEFAIWCAEQALEEGRKWGYEPHMDSLKALQVKRLWLDGSATDAELDAARSAAWSAARSAAWSVAESAAWSVARSAAWSAARSAAWSVARSVARSAQNEELERRLAILERAATKI